MNWICSNCGLKIDGEDLAEVLKICSLCRAFMCGHCYNRYDKFTSEEFISTKKKKYHKECNESVNLIDCV